MDLRNRVFALLKSRTMTTDELARELRSARSTVVNAINDLRADGSICIVEYRKTGVSPARIWGIGSTDAERPPTISDEERNAKRRERRAMLSSAQDAVKSEGRPRRDVAASWI